jgi:3,4-dihydroxy 2-butanone 4-phosphate synthase/GTP cyclohydrolase II
VSRLKGLSEEFACGEVVLVGDERDRGVFLATAAAGVRPERVAQLHELGRGMVVLGLAEAVADRLDLPEAGGRARARPEMSLTTTVDAAAGISGGWSLHDRALTMRVAADPDAAPRDLLVPGHVHPARVAERRANPAAAAVELARLSGHVPAVALGAVVDRSGVPATLREAREDPALGRLAVASTAELHSCSISRQADELAVSCDLPTRHGAFRAIGYGPAEDAPAIVALVHGDPATASPALVHMHVACLLGDAFGSLLCDCRRELHAAIAAIVRHGAGAVIYAKSDRVASTACAREERIESGLAAGLLRTAGVMRVRLSTRAEWLSAELRRCGLEVQG